jgi:hypothetical protein
MPNLQGRTEVTVDVPSNEGVWLGWPLVTATHPGSLHAPGDGLALLDGQSGILHATSCSRRRSRPRKRSDVWREAGWFELWADALAGQSHADVEKLLLALVGKMQRGEFTDADIATAIRTTRSARNASSSRTTAACA